MAAGSLHDHYAQMHHQFRWQVPEFFNMAQECSRRWAQAGDAAQRVAIYADGTGLTAVFKEGTSTSVKAGGIHHGLESRTGLSP